MSRLGRFLFVMLLKCFIFCDKIGEKKGVLYEKNYE